MECMLTELIKNGSGISCKSFFLVSVTIVGCLLLLAVCFAIVWEEFSNGYIKSELLGVSALIGSVSTLFGAAGLTKVIGEKNESNDINK